MVRKITDLEFPNFYPRKHLQVRLLIKQGCPNYVLYEFNQAQIINRLPTLKFLFLAVKIYMKNWLRSDYVPLNESLGD